jgi:hypothetical protein
MQKKSVRIIVAAVLTLIFAAVMFYVTLPAINLQSEEFWMFLFYCLTFYAVAQLVLEVVNYKKKNKGIKILEQKPKVGKGALAVICISIPPLLVLVGGSAISSTFFHASAYANLIEVPEANFADDMPETEVVNNIALMDTDTAIKMGNRTLGALSDVVSQYEISENYKQINYNKTPQKVSTLEYADFFKWLSNRQSGIPGYVMVDPVNVTDANYIKLEKPIKYSDSGYLGDDLTRKLRFSYPTKIFGNCSFEIDDNGNPYYIVACMQPRISMLGAYDVNEVIIFDPVSGSSDIYALSEVPTWVDNVFTGTLASQKYDWYGTLKNGFWNSIIGNKDCKVTTDDYGYIVIGDDVWFFTGVTSVTSDESNIGFIISNARTGEYKFYQVTGAEEYSAMESAQGQVQEKGYVASFPSLINVSGEATYIMVLKDSGGLVKLYALVNVENYAIVATGSTQTEAKEEYLKLLKQNGVIDELPEKEEIQSPNVAEANVEIVDINVYTVGGESVFYISASDGQIYKQRLCDDEGLIILRKGDALNIKYKIDSENLVREMVSFKILPKGDSSDAVAEKAE